ncbi:DUF669 domain-containing protein [Anaerovibrio sp. RM50]|uniref:DUF669 domain-containing protein n=1 Tax=Anaerovibrio sp. RM50 TaxID=1200557 RepID=UPI0004855F5F|nr:DUF669 domain-containing protein [Anaerovibrio sp. RM50]
MQKINGYESAEPIIGGGFYVLPTGNYKMKIIKAEENTSKSGRQMLKIAFDVADGEFKDFYKRKYEADLKRQSNTNSNKVAKWSNDAIYYQMCDEQNLGRFKGFIKCLEDSNSGFSWDWDETKLKGLVFAGQTHNEPSEYNGKVYGHNKLINIYPLSTLETLPILPDKELEQSFAGGFGGTVANDEEIPF